MKFRFYNIDLPLIFLKDTHLKDRMLRIEAIVQSDVSLQVVKAIRNKGAEAVTFMESLGQGSGERPEIAGEIVEFNSTQVVISVINDSQLDDVVSAIMDVAHTGQKRDGKIFVTEIKATYDISTKQKLSELG
jgi:nitrogen regulatory protein P-II 1